MTKTKNQTRRLEPFRSLTAYKAQHSQTAKDKKVEIKFHSAPTLTKARKILFGSTSKEYRCCKAVCYQCKYPSQKWYRG